MPVDAFGAFVRLFDFAQPENDDQPLVQGHLDGFRPVPIPPTLADSLLGRIAAHEHLQPFEPVEVDVQPDAPIAGDPDHALDFRARQVAVVGPLQQVLETLE